MKNKKLLGKITRQRLSMPTPGVGMLEVRRNTPVPNKRFDSQHDLSSRTISTIIEAMTDLSIIIISFNTRELTKKCLETVIKSLNSLVIPDPDQESIQLNGSQIKSGMTTGRVDDKIKTEIIVLDNASTDGSIEMLEAFEKSEIRSTKSEPNSNSQNIKFKIIESKENLGFAKGNNTAVKEAAGKTILFLNSDTEAITDAIPNLYNYFVGSENRFNFVGGKLLESDGKTPQASAGPAYSLPVVFAFLFLRGDYYHLTRFSPQQIKQVDWVSGACFICKKQDFEDLGGFDEKIFMYMEEIDLFYRADQNKLSIGFYPASQFVHHGSASSTTGRSEPIIKVFEGLLYFYNKHHGGKKFLLLKYMLIAKSTVALAIGKAFGNNYLISTYEKAQKLAKSA